jgi:hypothetical protein
MKNVILLTIMSAFVFACSPSANDEAARIAAAKEILLDSINQAQIVAQQQKTIDSLKIVSLKSSAKTKPVVAENDAPSPMVGSVSKSKKKMNNTTKGALIGVGVGVVTGVATSKDKVKGGIIGGIIGGGAGAGAGAIIDKKKKENNN